MPVYRHAERLLQPHGAASPDNRANCRIVLVQQTIVEAKFSMPAQLMPKVSAHEPGIEVNGGRAYGSQTGIEGIPAIRRRGPES